MITASNHYIRDDILYLITLHFQFNEGVYNMLRSIFQVMIYFYIEVEVEVDINSEL